ncbi:MAG: hemolysin family protein [Anaerolineae bacterium]|jgi:CBS domain containing-hemolysin-like protein
MSILLPLLIILLLILVNGLFVAAEFAIIGVRPTRIEELAKGGNRAAGWVHRIVSDRQRIDRYIATAQLGITLASLGLGMYAEPAIAGIVEEPLHDWFGLEGAAIHTVSFVLALGLVTYLHVVVGEMVPKSLALQNAEGTVLRLNGPMRLAGKIFSVPVTVLNRIGLWTLKILRVPPPGHDSRLYSPEELEMVVSESYAGGLLEEREQELVANILDFSEERVVQVMTPRPLMTAIPATISEEALLALYDEIAYSRVPVYEQDIDDVIGVLHLKDLVRQQLSGEAFDLRPLLRQVPFVPETLPVKALLAAFKREHQQMAIVIDEHGGTLGTVTLEDLLEEVVGEVRDEFDLEEEAPLIEVEPGYLLAQGTVQIEEIEEYVALGRQKYDVHTVGGLILAELGRVPVQGDEVSLGPATFRVEELEGLTIRRVSVRFSPQSGDQEEGAR